mmetsp:Transcript_67362/g.179840  ORF Transcript_67362/g.179840 Transcript_67362/m.179840 type:complete len:382 (+) Transcript_67362:95-1240(+)
MSEPSTKKSKHEEVPENPADSEIKARDTTAKQEEEAGVLQFKYVFNDGSATNLRYLCDLKDIFRQQLPQMPPEYIVRLVFDRQHKSVCAVKRQGSSFRVIGGICYRPVKEMRFGEIAFCAVKTEEQVRGYGTRLMNQTKHLSREMDGLDHFLTYADNFAVGYFKKQGFHQSITMERSRWAPYIKDYEGATLMECFINPYVDYLDIPTMIKRQRRMVESKIRSMTKDDSIHPGLKCFKQGVKSIDLADIPGVKEAGFTHESHRRGYLKAPKCTRMVEGAELRSIIADALAAVIKTEPSWPFREEVRAEDVPDYHTVIKDPIALSTMQKRLSEGFYKTIDQFKSDINLMVENCKEFNPKESVYCECAMQVQRFVDEYLRNLGV